MLTLLTSCLKTFGTVTFKQSAEYFSINLECGSYIFYTVLEKGLQYLLQRQED